MEKVTGYRDKKERQQIINQIGDLEINHCKNCNLVKTFPINNISSHCIKHCEIGKQLHTLGKRLLEGKESNFEGELTKEKYLKLKSKELTDKEIVATFNMGMAKFRNMKKKWDLIGMVNE